MNNIIERTWRQGGMVFPEDMRGTAFTAEDGAHTFIISGVDLNGDPINLSGTVAASLIRPDGTTTPMTGTISGGKASVTLSAECYGVGGRASLTIFLTSGGQKVAIFGARISIDRSSTAQASPGVAADVVDLVNRIDAAVATIPASYTALMAAIAPDYSSSSTYPKVGSFVWYSGTLYRSKVPIETAESWTAAHWKAAALGNDLNDDITSLKSAVSDQRALRMLGIDETAFVAGYLNINGAFRSNANYKSSPFIQCEYKRIEANALTSANNISSIAFYSDASESSYISGYINTEALRTYPVFTVTVPDGCHYIRICKNIDSIYSASITPYVLSLDSMEMVLERVENASGTANEALNKIDNLDPMDILSGVYREVVKDQNLVDNTAYTPHACVSNTGEIKTTTNPSSSLYPMCLSAYIPVIAGKTIYLNDDFISGQYYAFYQEDKTWIGGKNEYGAWYRHLGISSKIVPENAAWLRVTSSTEAEAQTLWAGYTGAQPTGEAIYASNNEYLDYHYFPTNPCDYNGNEIGVFNKIVCLGDSITSGYFNAASSGSQSIPKYSYPTQLQKITGVETVNLGVAGTTSVSWWAAHSTDDFSGYDCAIINFGINDALQSVPEADTRQAFASMISALKTANTGIKIFIANVNPAYARDSATYDAINAIIEDIATTTADCYFVDLTEYGHTIGVANADGHLTAVGYFHLAEDYKAAISYIMKNNPVDFRYVQFIGTNLQPAT